MLVADQIIEASQARGSEQVEPGDLHGRRLEREKREAVRSTEGVQVDEKVDRLLLDELRQIDVGELADIVEHDARVLMVSVLRVGLGTVGEDMD